MTTNDSFSQAEALIGRRFLDPGLLQTALTHASYAEHRRASNERLEFLGDAVLGLVVCEELCARFPDLLEGDLTKIKSAVVSRRTCGRIIRRLGLDEHLRLGKGMLTHERVPASVAAAVLESLIGAIYLDAGGGAGGIEAVREFLMPHLSPLIDQAAESGHQQNFKSVLQQHAQDTLGLMPEYVLLDEKGPDHAKCFEVCARVGADRYPPAWGASKKEAEQQAALLALEALGVITRDGEGRVTLARDRAGPPPADGHGDD
ncbi:MAG: ribonuclease III [Planctomycetota bacterium]|nr:MAG: ribonuclease III [Planctomycetota bacterium]